MIRGAQNLIITFLGVFWGFGSGTIRSRSKLLDEVFRIRLRMVKLSCGDRGVADFGNLSSIGRVSFSHQMFAVSSVTQNRRMVHRQHFFGYIFRDSKMKGRKPTLSRCFGVTKLAPDVTNRIGSAQKLIN